MGRAGAGRRHKAIVCPLEQRSRNQTWGGRPRPRRTPWSGSLCVRAGRPGGRPRAWGPAPQNRRRLRGLESAVVQRRNVGQALSPGVSSSDVHSGGESPLWTVMTGTIRLGVCRNETQAAGYGVGSQATPQPCFAAQSENQRKEAAILPRMSQFA